MSTSFFLNRATEGPIAEQEFKKTIQELREKWVSASELLSSVNTISEILGKMDLERSLWFEPIETLVDFEALSNTLLLHIKRYADMVRIKFV
ncbi:MAG TPA: hypothetical protein VK003_07840 [Oceanobacillus sp.]|nr:hypothetical protein [Oceanobacillus sp.]